mmetsp:Transcript_47503/g.134100  ORF Transcript_47503/g.134100 Transcript_47503/m.134100 type:complete len:235 (+) Transcript_47503:79-783(+)
MMLAHLDSPVKQERVPLAVEGSCSPVQPRINGGMMPGDKENKPSLPSAIRASKSNTVRMPLNRQMRGIPVMLHIYDLGPLSKWTLNGNAQNTGIGIFHCGVEVLGVEFSFQAIFNVEKHSEMTGIVCHTPRCHPRHVYRESIPLGTSSLCLAEIESLMAQLKRAWPAHSYHFLNRNCIDFAEHFAVGLGVPEPFPRWAHGLAKGVLQRTPLASGSSQLNCLGSCSSMGKNSSPM